MTTLLMVELAGIPRSTYQQIKRMKERSHQDIIIDLYRNRSANITRILIKGTAKGWWLALRIKMKGPSKLYRLAEVKELDLPSTLLKASLKRRWTSNLEREVSRALREGGWIE